MASNNSGASTGIEVDFNRGVATIKTGRLRGCAVAVNATANSYLAGHQTRANMEDALALSAGYNAMVAKVRMLEEKRQLAEAENVELKEKLANHQTKGG